jgi:hypothetical protein
MGRKGPLTCKNADSADRGRVTTARVKASGPGQSLAAVKSKNRGGSGGLDAHYSAALLRRTTGT